MIDSTFCKLTFIPFHMQRVHAFLCLMSTYSWPKVTGNNSCLFKGVRRFLLLTICAFLYQTQEIKLYMYTLRTKVLLNILFITKPAKKYLFVLWVQFSGFGAALHLCSRAKYTNSFALLSLWKKLVWLVCLAMGTFTVQLNSKVHRSQIAFPL